MEIIPFCPNSLCENHMHPRSSRWCSHYGYHDTKAFGRVPRFKCRTCRKTFSAQTFSIDFYAKKVVDYRDLLNRHVSSESVRAIGRSLNHSCGTIQNRIDRLSRQAAALHAELRPKASPSESICADGFVSFDCSQYFPNEITLSITSGSHFILDLSHATRKRSGTMTKAQKTRADALYSKVVFERGAIRRTFREVLESAGKERPTNRRRPFVLNTDEKKEYMYEFRRWHLFRNQDEEHRYIHCRINSKLPRNYYNPLLPSNYLDREIRKDQANHHRETTCFSRNVSNAMERLLCYIVHHNYCKRYRIKAKVEDQRVHAEVAGIDRLGIDRDISAMFKKRVFLSRIKLPVTLERIWKKGYVTPLKAKAEYLPAYAMA